ncbi:MAG: phospho-sugar mutase, partial [Flavobacteriaceae bacterium]|nr:phospho-sugar mutase [Flavobacteriaceae bacterium]
AMVVMCHFLLEQWKKTGKLNGNQFLASTIVSTPMVKVITESFGVKYKEGLTGFKWIAKMVKDFPELEFIGGGEESFGFMVGDFVRDKDAVTATLLACEIAALKKQQGSSIYGYLQELYKEYGYYLEQLVSMVKKGKKGAEEIIAMMRSLRENPMKEIAGSKVVRIEDYESGKATDILNGKVTEMDIPRSNVLIYFTEDGSKIAARPSGTEPKIKFYMSVHGSGNNESIMAELHQKIERIKTELQL